MSERRQVVVIGAGPSGAIASALLHRRQHDVLVLERQRFPRFSIGESLLVHCLDFVAEAGMLDAVDSAGFQCKDGAAFARGGRYATIEFSERLTPGRTTTFEVPRAKFDQLLADQAERQGVEIRYQTEIVSVDCATSGARLVARGADGAACEIDADFVLDASGFGRTLPRLFGLETPSDFPPRQALFTHVADRISASNFDRNKILVTVHPQHRDVWYWLIPFSDGRASLGVVARPEFLEGFSGTPDERMKQVFGEDPDLVRLLAQADWDTPVREMRGYAANVRAMHGPRFALLGNAAEFLDPVFSSGVTIAMRSASMAVDVLDRQLRGEAVDWERDFARPLRRGVDCFRAYVEAWYDGRFQDIVFHEHQPTDIRRMICSILAGYAWDLSNPFVAQPKRRLGVLAQLCAS